MRRRIVFIKKVNYDISHEGDRNENCNRMDSG